MINELDNTFANFIEASRLTNLDVAAFVARSEGFDPPVEAVSIFDQAGPEIELPAVSDRLQRVFEARKSVRVFTDAPISTNEISEVLAAAGSDAEERPLVASAGGLDPLGLYAFVTNSDGELDRSIVHYQHKTHTAAPVGSVPDDDVVRELFGIDCEGMPQLLLVFAVDPAATISKYGSRGGRFLLQQVGMAMSNVGLRLATSELRSRIPRRQTLHGYVLGGVLDDVSDHLHVTHTRALIIGGYAIGH